MKRVKTQTINVDEKLWEEAKVLAEKNHHISVSQVVANLLEEWLDSKNKHITIKHNQLMQSTKVRRSLYCDRELWREAKEYAKEHFNKSGSHIIDVLLRNWVFDERKRKSENPKQARLI